VTPTGGSLETPLETVTDGATLTVGNSSARVTPTAAFAARNCASATSTF
jgi:hypothetical protein